VALTSGQTAKTANDPVHVAGAAGLSALEGVRPLYFLPADPLSEEVLIPGFRAAGSVDCMAGFFSSAVLASLAPGLATFLARGDSKLRLIVSPFLRPEDRAAIDDGTKSPEVVAAERLEDLIMTEDMLARHTLRCLSHLLRAGRIEIRIAIMEDALFHPKVWLFAGDGKVMAAHGSSNLTAAGIRKNFEQITVSRSWEDANQRYITEKLGYQFERLWNNREDSCKVISAPEAITQDLLRTYGSDEPPTEDECRALFKKAREPEPAAPPEPVPVPTPTAFSVPSWLKYDQGPFEHQGRAVKAWCEAGFGGVLEMATGSGKTITAMICANRLFEARKPLLIVVAAPYVPLIQQWCEEIEPFGLKPVNLTTVGGASQRARALSQVRRRLRTGISEAEAVVVSYDTLCTQEFTDIIAGFDCARLLIADEAHNLGRVSFSENPPECYDFRLGLSATPVRQYDEDGTEKLFAYFGPVVFRFTLEEAIGRCLVEYEYYLHPVYLSTAEMDAWYELTGKIKQNAWRDDGGKPDDYLAKLLRDRRALLETAEGKIALLAQLLDKEDLKRLRHTLIYATDKAPAQLDEVNRLLQDRSLLFHQLTAEETADRKKTSRIIKSFQQGEIQVLTAKRVLDEGVNIPQICRAYVLASTTVERQWVQRRGRLLRTCGAIGKKYSVIHDFLALPPDMDKDLDPDARSMVRSELKRAQEFARLAMNAGRDDGPLAVIHKLVDAAYM